MRLRWLVFSGMILARLCSWDGLLHPCHCWEGLYSSVTQRRGTRDNMASMQDLHNLRPNIYKAFSKQCGISIITQEL